MRMKSLHTIQAVSYTHLDVYKRQVSGYEPYTVYIGEDAGGEIPELMRCR